MEKSDKRNIEDIFALTPMQEGMLFHYLKDTGGDHYFEQLSLEISGEIHVERFRKAWNFVIETNEMLRAVFRWEKVARPVQIILKKHKLQPGYYDLSVREAGEKNSLPEDIKIVDRKKKFDLRQVPFRVTLCRIEENKHLVIISNHHILYDGWSTGILLREFFKTYNDLSMGKEWVKPVKTKFKEFVKWIRNQDIEKQEEFWRNYLKDVGTGTHTGLAVKRTAGKQVTGTEKYSLIFERGVKVKLEDFAKKQKVTLASCLYCVWGLLLQRYNNSGDVIFGTTVSGRSAKVQGIEEIVGLFINTLPFRVQCPAGEMIEDLLCRIDSELQGRGAYETTPLVSIKEYSEKESTEELFDTIVVMENYPLDSRLMLENSQLSVNSCSIVERTHYDLTLGIALFEDLQFNFIYNTEAFDEDIIGRLAGHFCRILEDIIENPGKAVHEIELLSEEEKKKIVLDFNDTAVEFPADKTLHELFEEQAEQSPEGTVLVGNWQLAVGKKEEMHITYGVLNEKSGQLARSLREKGVLAGVRRTQPINSIVGIMVERSLEMITGILGILKAGGAYLPIDPDYPRERIDYMLKDSEAKLLVTTGNLAKEGEKVRRWEGEICYIEKLIYFSYPLTFLPSYLQSLSNPAYVIYTSGTTGRPKGTLVQHRSLVNLCYWHNRYYGVTEKDHATQYANFAFDASVWEIFPYLIKGAALHIIGEDIKLDMQGLGSYYKKHHITISFLPTQLCQQFMEEAGEIPSLRCLLTGGDRLNRFVERGYRLYNNYGPTENTVVTTSCLVEAYKESIPIGKPIDNCRVYILNKDNFQLQPLEVAGELCVAGDSLASGYLNRPELTAEKFDRDLWDFQDYQDENYKQTHKQKFFGGSRGAILQKSPPGRRRLYRTGDLARWLWDGNIEFLGRRDQQVKIRGFRVETGEIENCLLAHPGIGEAVVIPVEDNNSDKHLCAYIVVSGEVTVPGVRDYLSGRLPGYMVPSYFLPLEKIPLTPNGKVDRRALPLPAAEAGDRYIAPRNKREEILTSLWAELLGIEKKRIGIDDNFFHLGGHSLKAISLIAGINKEFNVELSISKLFETPTIRGLAHYISKSEERLYSAIEPAEKKEYYALSSAQKRLFILHRLDKTSTAYNMCETLLVEGILEKEKLEKVFRHLIIRHESLRTSFVVLENEPVQRIHDEVEFGVESFDLATELGGAFIRSFDLSRAPLLRVGLIHTPALAGHPSQGVNSYILMVDMHHIISDGVSAAVFVKEFMSIYKGERLPALRIHYKDFSEWQNSEEQKEGIKRQEQYWIKEFEREIPVLNLPADYRRPEIYRFEGSQLQFRLERTETGGLKTFALRENATLFMVLLAGYNVLLSRLCSQEDIIVGSPAAGRRHVDLEPVMGFFINTLPLRNFPVREKTFKQFIEEVKQRTLQAFAHQDYPYEELVEKVAVERDTGRNPLFDTLFSLQNFDRPEIEMPGLRLKPYDDETRAAKFDLTLQGWEREGELWFILEYNTNLFKKETIRRFIIYFRRIISSLLEDYSGRLGEIEILPAEEKKKILYDFNDTAVAYPQNKSIHELFEEQAEKALERTAVVGGSQLAGGGAVRLTYKELNEKSNQAAYWLREKGVLADSAVAIMMERSIEMIIGIIGILKSGAAYMPIDPGYPQERIDYILKDSGAKLLVTTNNLEALDFSFLPATGRQAPSTSLAYVIYTSGSGGKPKGVMVEHSSVVNVLSALQAAYPLGESDTYLFKTSYIFDVSVAELFGWFWSGGRLAVLDAGGEKEPGKIIEAVERQCVTHINFVPSMFSVFMEHVEQSGLEKITRLSGLKYIFLAGEALLPDLVERFNRLGTGIPLENIYGPTEASVYSSWYSLAHWDGKGGIPIGKPMPNIRLYILDNAGGLQPIGIPGELCISGAGVARGYLNNPGLTAEKFIYYRSNRSYRTYFPEKIYKTGDLARWLVDGGIEFLGRMDFQVKIRGFRIELGEIESRLLRHPGVKEAVVVTGEVEIGDKYLCAYIVPGSAGRFDSHSSMEEELRDHLSASLPGYMIPAYFVPVDKIPHTPSGKVDRKALPEPGIKSGETYVAPGNEIEERLAVIWAEVLGCEKGVIGINDHFFKIGGHSLKAVGLINRIYKEFSIEIPLVEIFRTPTIRGIGRCIQTGKKIPYLPIGPVEEREYYELSSAQERLFVLHRMEPDTVTYNIFDMMVVEGRLERDRFEDSVKTLIKRHESLMTSFEVIDEVPVQRIHDEVEFGVEYFELATGAGGAFIRPFDLSTAPLLRMGLMKIGDDKHMLMVDMHHIISDGVSIGIFIKEFGTLYMGKEMPGLRVRYRDFSYWQNQLFTSPVIEKQRAYWRGQFEGEVPVLNLPYDFPRPLVQRFEGARIDFDVASGETGFLKQSVLKKGTTTFIMLLAVLNVFLSKLSSQEDITVGVPTAGRNHPDLEGLIGMFVNTLPLRTIAAAEKSFGEFAKEVEETFLAASERQDYPYEELVENLALKRDVSRNPLYDVVFALENNVVGTLEIPGLKWTPCEYENRTAKFDLTLLYIDMGDTLRFTFEYSTALFKEATIHRFICYFRKLLANILESGDRHLWELEIIPDREKKQILVDFNATVKDYPREKSLHELFEEQAAKTPDSVSAVGGTARITYKELNRKSGQLVRSLREKGVLADSIAAIMVHRSIEMIIGVLGILKAGGAYLPIDPDYPRERIDYMLKDSGAKVLLTNLPEGHRFNCQLSIVTCHLSMNSSEADFHHSSNQFIIHHSDLLAYVIYTSGTTGWPKGTLVQHRSLVNLCYWHNRYYGVTEKDHATQYANFAFDASVWEIFPYLIKGAALHIIGEDIKLDMQGLGNYYKKHHITISFLPTQLCQQFMEEAGEIPSLRCLLTGGDRLNRLVERGYRLYNNYGPTENTVVTTSCLVEAYKESIPIGKPIDNCRVYILNKENFQLQPLEVAGELCVAGDSLASGYLNRPELTAEKFDRDLWDFQDYQDENYKQTLKQKFFGGSRGAILQKSPPGRRRLYRTGDLARWLWDGNIEFLGRRDHQVKIRGFRVETGEIENCLLAHPGISEAMVIPVEDNNSDKHLCAYIVVSGKVTVPGVRDYLSGRLPGYMVPSYFLPLEKIPLTPNGKVDRRALPVPAPEAGDRYAAPRNEREKIMTSLWAEVLGIEKERIGIDDDFFQLGGHSLKAVRITGRVHKTFDIELPVSKIFEFPTIRELAQYINKTEKSIYSSIEPAEKKEYYALSSAQKRLFILQQLDETSSAYNVHDMLLVEGILQEEKLVDVFRELIARHESLRTSFFVWEGESVQKIHDHVEFEIEYLAAKNAKDREEIIKNFIRPFDLSRAPLLRVGLIHTPALVDHPLKKGDSYILMVDMHHIISDGLSVELLVREFSMLFKGETLPELSLQYKDFSEWQNRRKDQKIIKQQEAYWLKEFESGIPLLKLPQDFPRPEVYSFDGSMRTFKVEREETAKLRRLAAAEECTLFMLLLSCFYILISKLNSQEDIVVGTPVVGRRHPQLEGIIGMFVNTLALRNQPTREKNFKEFLAEVKDHTLTAFENQDYPFEDLVDKVVPRRVLNRNALFDVMFSLQNTYLSGLEIPGLKLSRYEYESGISKFDLLLSCDGSEEDLNFTFEYNTTLFKQETLEQWIIYFKRLITSVCAEPGKRIADIEIMTAEEKKQLMFAFYDDDAALPGDEGYEQKAGVYAAPGDELEMKLVDIWTEILGIEKERIGIDFSFFDLGGHSYSATIMVSKIHKALAAKVTLVEVFKRPHIRGIAEYIRGSGTDAGTDIAGKYASVELVEKREYYPLSSAQQRLFLLYQVGGAVNTVYNLPVAMMVEGRPDKKRFENVFHLLIKRHESLRTSFHVINGESAQRIHDEVEFAIEYFSAADDAEILPTDFIRPFELSQAPLMRVGLVNLEAEKHLLIFDMHHIISDAVSMRILVEESIRAYEGKPLPEISIQYKDFAHWQNRLFERGGLKKQEQYWLDRFKGDMPVLKMPGDYARPVKRNFEGDNLTFYIDKDLTGKIKHILSRTDTTLYIGLLAVYFLLLYKYTEQEDIIVGIASSGRNHADIENVIGVFINTLAIRAYPSGDKTFGHFLEEVKGNALSAYDHQDYPFETLVDRLGIPRDLSRNPLVDVLFISENVDAPVLQIEELKFTPYEFGAGVSHVDLVLLTAEEDDKIRVLLEYSTGLFKRSTAEKISQRYIEILGQVTANPRVKLRDIEISVESGGAEAGVNIDEFVDFDF